MESDWVSDPPKSRLPLRPCTNPPVWTLTLRALIITASGQGERRNTETEATTRAWHEGLRFFYFFICYLLYFLLCRMSMRITDDAMEVHFSLRLFDRATDHAYCHNHPSGSVNTARELRHLHCGQVIRATLSKTHPWSGWRSAAWLQPFPLGP